MASTRDRNVFFSWERRPLWLLGRRGMHLRVLSALLALLALLWWLGSRERHKANLRATRAAISTTYFATMSFRADHQGRCPRAAADLVAGGYLHDLPIDAWGSPLRIECGGAADVLDVVVSSDGPDGLPHGLDQVR